MTYRKGFEPIKDTTYTSDVSWGCMIRSSQMLFAQALLFHRLGRSWRIKKSEQPEQEYLETLEPFGDAEASAFSIHNLILVGESYGLAAGSWIGPYAICRSWESLACKKRKETDSKHQTLSMAIHIVSGSEDAERGGAPILCLEDVTKSCVEFSEGQAEWTPLLLLVPLVLGLDRVNPRYIPSLKATFTFPQSLGILGGKPGVSTYIVGVQDDNDLTLKEMMKLSLPSIQEKALKYLQFSSHHHLVIMISLRPSSEGNPTNPQRQEQQEHGRDVFTEQTGEQNIPDREEQNTSQPAKRRARKTDTPAMDYEQTIIAGPQYQSWLQDTSHILLKGKKRKAQRLVGPSIEVTKRMKLPPTQLFEEHEDGYYPP